MTDSYKETPHQPARWLPRAGGVVEEKETRSYRHHTYDRDMEARKRISEMEFQRELEVLASEEYEL